MVREFGGSSLLFRWLTEDIAETLMPLAAYERANNIESFLRRSSVAGRLRACPSSGVERGPIPGKLGTPLRRQHFLFVGQLARKVSPSKRARARESQSGLVGCLGRSP